MSETRTRDPRRAATVRRYRRRRGDTSTARVSLLELGERLEAGPDEVTAALEAFFGDVADDAREAYRRHLSTGLSRPVA